MSDGTIQNEFVNALKELKIWIDKYGESVYGTDAGYITLSKWGCIAQKQNKSYLHVLNDIENNQLEIKDFPKKNQKSILVKRQIFGSIFEKRKLLINSSSL